MNARTIVPPLEKAIELRAKHILFRQYDLEHDAPKLAKYLYDQSKTPEQIRQLEDQMKAWHQSSHVRAILVAEYNQESMEDL